MCGGDPKVCIHTDKISFPQFVSEAEYEQSEHSWWKKCVVLNPMSLKKHTALHVIQFSQHDISIHTSLVLYIFWYRI
jgi:hypothetical protein